MHIIAVIKNSISQVIIAILVGWRTCFLLTLTDFFARRRPVLVLISHRSPIIHNLQLSLVPSIISVYQSNSGVSKIFDFPYWQEETLKIDKYHSSDIRVCMSITTQKQNTNILRRYTVLNIFATYRVGQVLSNEDFLVVRKTSSLLYNSPMGLADGERGVFGWHGVCNDGWHHRVGRRLLHGSSSLWCLGPAPSHNQPRRARGRHRVRGSGRSRHR